MPTETDERPRFLSDSLHLNSLRMTFAPYKDTYNGMWFSLDKEFIQSGKTGQIEENPAGYAKLYKMLRDLFLMEYGTVTI
ncbi:unnamed protein product [Arabidopsis halleri]